MYHIDEENSDVYFEVNGDKVAFKVMSSGGGGKSDIYLIKVGEQTIPTDKNTFSALRILAEITAKLEAFKKELEKETSNKYIHKDKPDSTEFLVKFLAGLEAGVFKSGLSGAKIDKLGNAEIGRLLTRLKATLAELQVNGASEFRGSLSSEEFASGFIGGKGWAILKKEVLNALGIPETKYTAEFDDLIVRGTMRVYEMIVSQLLGENDNRIFTAMMEVDHYDPSTGKVYLNTCDGKLYNPFRKGDYIMVQQFNGMPSPENNHYVTKHYELVITDAGCGNLGDGEDRLDWVRFENFTCSMEGGSVDLITKGDTFVRVDNATDPDRKGIMQIMTVGNKTPYMDIIYGLKTDPDNYLKGRLGNLAGIKHHLFGWLQGFGELLTNLYAVGDFRLRQTGESLDSRVEILKGQFATSYRKLNYDLTEEDNYLKNAAFAEDMAHWTAVDDVRFVTVNDEAMIVNRSTVVLKNSYALIEEYDGADRLHLCNSSMRQSNADIRKPGTHKEYKKVTGGETSEEWVEVKDTLYLSVRFLARTSGTLTVGFQGAGRPDEKAMPMVVQAVTSSYDWQTVQVCGTWDGTGDFILQYTGDMYVSLLAVTDRALEDFKKEVSTQILQTAGNIRLLGTNINNLKGTVTDLGIDLDAAKERISIYADKVDNLTGRVTSLGLRIDAAEESITLYAKKIGNNETAIATLQVRADSISSAVTSTQGDLDAAKARIESVKAIAESAGDAEVYNQADNPWNSWPGGTEHKHVGAVWHNKSDGHIYRYIGYDRSNSWEDVTGQQDAASYILQTKDKISTVVGAFDASGNLTNTSGLVTTAYASSVYATKNTVDALSGKLTSQSAQIDVHSTQISMRVEKDDIISSINQSAESVTISASKININGVATINDSFRVEKDGTTHIGPFTVTAREMRSEAVFETDYHTGFILSAEQIEFYNERSGASVKIGGNTNWITWDGIQYRTGINITSPNVLMGVHIKTPSIPLFVEGGNIALHPDKSGWVSLHGLRLNARSVAVSAKLNANDDVISFTNTSDIDVTMPDAYPGKVLLVKKYNTARVTLRGGTFMNANDGGTGTTFTPAQHSHMFVYDIRGRWVDFYCG